MNQTALINLTVGEIVTNDFRIANIFKEAGIDFCCGGKQELQMACVEKGVDPVKLIKQIEELDDIIDLPHDFKNWDVVFLSDYIVNTHHKFVLKSLPELLFYTDKIATVHGENHPELLQISNLFEEINNELKQHLKNEEEVLFPAIRQELKNPGNKVRKVIASEIERMFGEHDFAGNAMDKINLISKGYKIPEDACKTYEVTFKLLRQFEDDLHVHVHLENNILFPKALKLVHN